MNSVAVESYFLLYLNYFFIFILQNVQINTWMDRIVDSICEQSST